MFLLTQRQNLFAQLLGMKSFGKVYYALMVGSAVFSAAIA